MLRRPPRAKLTDTLFPCTALVRYDHGVRQRRGVGDDFGQGPRRCCGGRGPVRPVTAHCLPVPCGRDDCTGIPAVASSASSERSREVFQSETRTTPASRDRVTPSDTAGGIFVRSEKHTSELQSLMRISYAVF